VTKDCRAGSPVAAADAIHCSSSRPRRPVMSAAKARTCAVTAASSGELARMASRRAWSSVARLSGLVMIQVVTVRVFGGLAGGAGT
jgi:hypothetical protein